jgi:hypothetical protein
MEYKIINIGDYLIIVDGSEIKVGDYITDRYKVWKWNDDSSLLGRKKVISHLPLNNSPILDGIDLLPPIEDDVEELVKNHWETNKELNNPSSFKSGYNKHAEKYRYTEKHLDDAISWGINNGRKGDVTITDIDNYIQSLRQPKIPVGFKCEVITMNKGYNEESDYPYQQCDIPKTITNSQGITQLVGEYIY